MTAASPPPTGAERPEQLVITTNWVRGCWVDVEHPADATHEEVRDLALRAITEREEKPR